MQSWTSGRTFKCTAAAAAIAFGVAACGGSPTSDKAKQDAAPAQTPAEQLYAEIGPLTGQERRDRLVELASAEGALDFYTSYNTKIAEVLVEAFEDAFADVSVSVYRASSEAVRTRIEQEQEAKFAGNDIVETNASEMFILAQQDRFADYVGPRRELLPAEGRFEGWTADRLNLFAPAWNTNKVKPGEQPMKWEDLADPKWNGRMSLELTDDDWYLTLYGYFLEQGKSEAEVEKLFADMADGAKIVKGHTVQRELLSAGEFDMIGAQTTYITLQGKKKGAPVETQPFVEPVFSRPNGFGLMKTANNPAAAMLFADWLLEEGQVILAEEGLTPAIPQGDDDPLKGVELLPVDLDKLINENDKWTKKYEQLVTGAAPAK